MNTPQVPAMAGVTPLGATSTVNRSSTMFYCPDLGASITRKEALALIWRHTHKDFKGGAGDDRRILTLRQGGTHSVPLTGLTDVEIIDKLPHCIKREIRRVFERKKATDLSAAARDLLTARDEEGA